MIVGDAQTASDINGNRPLLRIEYPRSDSAFVAGMHLRLRAQATDTSCGIKAVQFYTESNTIQGAVTSAPYEVWWTLSGLGGQRELRALAVSNCGVTCESESVRVAVLGGPPPFFEFAITSPHEGDIFLPGQAFTFAAEAMAIPMKDLQFYPVYFHVGTNRVATFATPQSYSLPFSVVVTNLAIGSHALTVRSLYGDVKVIPVNIRVARLGIRAPRVEGSSFAFDVATALSEQPTIVQGSPELGTWSGITTNTPATNSFRFVDPSPLSSTGRFYRAVVPP